MKNTKTFAQINKESVTVVKNGVKFSAHSQHPMFKKIVARVRRKSFAGIEKLFALKDVIEKCFNVEIKNGETLYYKGEKVSNVLTEKILGCVRVGDPYKPYVKLLNNLMTNPSEMCRNQLFNFIEKFGLAIDANGWVYGYKAVNSRLKAKFDNKTQYVIGQTLKVDRNKCASLETDACGFGLHIGEVSYCLGYGSDPTDRFLLLKFNPRDAISCPIDLGYKKLRVCSIVPVREVKREDVIPLKDQYLGAKKKKAKKG